MTIREQLDAIAAKLDSTHDAVVAMRTRCESCQQLIDQHDRVIDGNGEGLRTQVALLMAFRRHARRWAWLLLGAVVALGSVVAESLLRGAAR